MPTCLLCKAERDITDGLCPECDRALGVAMNDTGLGRGEILASLACVKDVVNQTEEHHEHDKVSRG